MNKLYLILGFLSFFATKVWSQDLLPAPLKPEQRNVQTSEPTIHTGNVIKPFVRGNETGKAFRDKLYNSDQWRDDEDDKWNDDDEQTRQSVAGQDKGTDNMPRQKTETALTTGNDSILAINTAAWADSLANDVDSIVKKEYKHTVVHYSKKKIKRGRHRRSKTVTVKSERIVDDKFAIGCSIYDLTDDSLIYSFNGDASFKPASTQKLFTCITALDKLGYDYTFQTKVYRDGSIKKDSLGRQYLEGDICISGCYDPTLKSDDVRVMANGIEELGIDSISGHIYATGFNYAKNNILLPLYNILHKDSLIFSEKKPYAESKEFLSQLKNMKLINTIDTPMEQVMTRMMKRSNNDYAEAVMHNICDPHSTSWSYDSCKEEVRRMIKRTEGDVEDYEIYDGSGLSHSNRCTPELQTDILRYAYRNKKIFPYLYKLLPVAGVDGTLHSRLKETPAFDNVHAKTGTINGVITLAGYVKSLSTNHMLAFSIMVNEVSSKGLARSIQDSICKILAH